MPGFSAVAPDNTLNIYGNTGVIRMLQQFFWKKLYFNNDFSKFRLNPVEIESFKPIVLEDQNMEWIPLPADHQIGMPGEQPQFFVVRMGKSWVMFANDTGYFRDAVWEYLEAKRFKLDVVITDCTGGICDNERGHLSGKYVVDTKLRLEKMGSVTENTQYFINHFSHNGHAIHSELEEHFQPYGIQVAYDGLKIQF